MVDPPPTGDAQIDQARAILGAADERSARSAALQREAHVHLERIARGAHASSPDERARRVERGSLSIHDAIDEVRSLPLDEQRDAAAAIVALDDVSCFRAAVGALRWQLDARVVIERGYAIGGAPLASELARDSMLPSYELCSLLFALGGHELAATRAEPARAMLAMPLEGLDAWTWALQLALALDPEEVRAQVLEIADEIDAQARAGALLDPTDSELDPRFAMASAMVHLGEHGRARAWLERGLREDNWPARAGWSTAIRAVRRALTPEQDRALGQRIIEDLSTRAARVPANTWRTAASALDGASSRECLDRAAPLQASRARAPSLDLAPWVRAIGAELREAQWDAIATLAERGAIDPVPLFASCPSGALDPWTRRHRDAIRSIESAATVLRAMEPGPARATLARWAIEQRALVGRASNGHAYAIATALEDDERALRWLAERVAMGGTIPLEALPPRPLADALASMLDARDRGLAEAPWSTLLAHLDDDAQRSAIAARCAAWVLDQRAFLQGESDSLAPSTARALASALALEDAEALWTRAMQAGRGALAHTLLARIAALSTDDPARARRCAAAMNARFSAVADDAWARACWRWLAEGDAFEWPAAASPDVLAQSYERDVRCFHIGDGALPWGAQFDAQRAIDWAALLWPRCSASARRAARTWIEPAYTARRRVGLRVERWLSEAVSVECVVAAWVREGPREAPHALLHCAHELRAMGGDDAVRAISEQLVAALMDRSLAPR